MKILSIMKKIILVILVLLLFAPLIFADVIYLKDGSILRGKITEETSESITIEGEGYWKTVYRTNIEKIIKEPNVIQKENIALKAKIERLEKELNAERAKTKKLGKESENLLELIEDFEKVCGLYNRLYNDNVRMRPRPGYKLTYTGQHDVYELNKIMRSRRWIFLIRNLSQILKRLIEKD